MLVKLLSRMDTRSFENSVISLTGRGRLFQQIQDLGVDVQALGYPRGIPNPMIVKRLMDTIRSKRPDLVQTWMYHSDLAGGLATRLVSRTTPVIWNIRNEVLPGLPFNTNFVIRMCALASKFIPARIIVNSHRGYDSHIRVGYPHEKMIIIENGFDVDTFRADGDERAKIRTNLGIPMDSFVIGMIANLRPQKDHPTFLEAASILHEKSPDVHFILVGGDCTIENMALSRLFHGRIHEDRLHLLGIRRDMPAIMASLDLCTLSSFHEGFPNVLGEAMSCKVPCVATDVGDSAYLIGDTGLIVPPRNPAALASAWSKMSQLTKEKRNIMEKAARKRIQSRFGLQQVINRYQELYLSLISSRNS